MLLLGHQLGKVHVGRAHTRAGSTTSSSRVVVLGLVPAAVHYLQSRRRVR